MWSLIFTEDQRFMVFGHRVLKRVEVTGGWTETNNELQFYPFITYY
jgi:hypothetical protein